MVRKIWKYRAVILTNLAVLSAVSLPVLTNIKTLAQTPSVEAQCTDVEIQRHIQQLNKGEFTDFNALVGCDSKAVPALIKALENEDVNFRIITIAALGEIGSKATPAVPVLNGLLKDTRENIRIVVVYALEQIIGKDAVSAAIIAVLKDPDSNIRAAAADTLGQIGTDAEFAVPYLTTALKDPYSRVRLAATNALKKIKQAALISELNKKRYYTFTCVGSTVGQSCAVSEMIAHILVKNNPPVMCRIPLIKALLKWKCPLASWVNNHGR